MEEKKIILTGGGTAGHVTPNMALVPGLKEEGWDILYIGSRNGIEKEICADHKLPYKGISSGKLRRYLNLKNLSDPFRVIKGFFQAKKIMKSYRPDIVFSKGGFVAVPVVAAAACCKVPVISHECDMTPGLANKLAAPFSTKICCNFPETLSYLPQGKGVLSGSPIRAELLEGDRKKGLKTAGFTGDRPVILVIGGSLGAKCINEAVRSVLDKLLAKYDIIHICGKGNVEEALKGKKGYVQYDFVNDELPDLFAAADLFISRAGANAICEILALKKPNLLIPLSREASRGDQILNAASFEKQGYSKVLEEENLSGETLLGAVDELYAEKDRYRAAMEGSPASGGVEIILGLIREVSGKK